MLSDFLVIIVTILLLGSVNTLTNNEVHILYREIAASIICKSISEILDKMCFETQAIDLQVLP